MSYLGAIEDIGANPYQIAGDPVMALVAQLNRFAGKTISAGGKCGSRTYLPHGALPLTTIMSDHAATIANVVMFDLLNCVSDERLIDARALAKVTEGLNYPTTWAMKDLSNITTRIAQFADSLGLNAAAVGITKVDPKVAPKFPTMTVAIVGALAVAAFVVSRKR